jgi:hypothetical protein
MMHSDFLLAARLRAAFLGLDIADDRLESVAETFASMNEALVGLRSLPESHFDDVTPLTWLHWIESGGRTAPRGVPSE